MRVPSIPTLLSFTVILSISIWNASGNTKHSNDLSNFYRAAVFEHRQLPRGDNPDMHTINGILGEYKRAAKLASENDAEIIIFPEKGLFPLKTLKDTWYFNYTEDIPDPRKKSVNPCNQEMKFEDKPILRNLSCLAKEYKMYTVVGTADKKKCLVRKTCNEYVIDHCVTSASKCPKNNMFYFNTLVVFNKEGLLIARYHKRHPYFEGGITPATDQRTVTFNTEFGTFATDICFDLLFGETVSGVKNISQLAFPTWWFDHSPFMYFATPYQQAWSKANNINILAADIQDPNFGSVGSGIYTPRYGALIYTHNPDYRSKLLISNVPKSTYLEIDDKTVLNRKFFYVDDDNSVTELEGEEPRNFNRTCDVYLLGKPNSPKEYRCFRTEVHQYTFIKLAGTYGSISICSNNFCCSLTYDANSMEEDYYFGVSGKPLNFYDSYLFGVQGCFLSRCETLNGQTCRNFILNSNTIFTKAEIKGNFNVDRLMPFAVDSEIRLTDRNYWNFDGKSEIKYHNPKMDSSLLFLGLYGRQYGKDKDIQG